MYCTVLVLSWSLSILVLFWPVATLFLIITLFSTDLRLLSFRLRCFGSPCWVGSCGGRIHGTLSAHGTSGTAPLLGRANYSIVLALRAAGRGRLLRFWRACFRRVRFVRMSLQVDL